MASSKSRSVTPCGQFRIVGDLNVKELDVLQQRSRSTPIHHFRLARDKFHEVRQFIRDESDIERHTRFGTDGKWSVGEFQIDGFGFVIGSRIQIKIRHGFECVPIPFPCRARAIHGQRPARCQEVPGKPRCRKRVNRTGQV